MMKKKISILSLAILFFASTVGLPFVLHYCEMMESVSFEVCEMHNVQSSSVSCCETKNEADVFLTNGYDQCCSTKLVDLSVKDNFVISKSDLISKTQLPVVLCININSDLSKISSAKFYTDTSPPPISDNHIYLTNSVLLI